MRTSTLSGIINEVAYFSFDISPQIPVRPPLRANDSLMCTAHYFARNSLPRTGFVRTMYRFGSMMRPHRWCILRTLRRSWSTRFRRLCTPHIARFAIRSQMTCCRIVKTLTHANAPPLGTPRMRQTSASLLPAGGKWFAMPLAADFLNDIVRSSGSGLVRFIHWSTSRACVHSRAAMSGCSGWSALFHVECADHQHGLGDHFQLQRLPRLSFLCRRVV